jgi:hypothetical protein
MMPALCFPAADQRQAAAARRRNDLIAVKEALPRLIHPELARTGCDAAV